MAAPLVFIDLAGPDADILGSFYAEVFGWTAGDDHQFDLEVLTPMKGAFRQDPTEHRLYLGVDDVSATLQAVEAHGGSVDTPRFEVPGVVVLGLFRDPAGNPMGLVELEGGKAKIP